MLIDKEYPATHSMTTAWYMVDDDGNIAIMQADDNGPVPFGVMPEGFASNILFGEGLDENEKCGPIELTKEQIEQLRAEAKATIPARVAAIAAMHSFKYGRVTIRATRSKWGSCTAQGDISLSLFLMTLPEHLRDYVILHELCHTVHHNHSPQFHSLVNSLCGGRERELAAQLRQYAIR